ncbi:hypothetical protein KC19_6G200800 [Ceratodon purpureus]|uniref:Uncharacterized protein n=1 Tax=Ceratodon purpureus TaxID=3225 RepID=A0A8T0HJI8_CERPU|nr:hypothetical protein KC19_6G200800 [Ceratodon purpureus]
MTKLPIRDLLCTHPQSHSKTAHPARDQFHSNERSRTRASSIRYINPLVGGVRLLWSHHALGKYSRLQDLVYRLHRRLLSHSYSSHCFVIFSSLLFPFFKNGEYLPTQEWIGKTGMIYHNLFANDELSCCLFFRDSEGRTE